MNSDTLKSSRVAARIATFRPSQRLIRGVDLAGKWSAPIADLIILILAAIIAPAFYNPTNLKTVAIQIAVLGIVAAGQTLVLLVRSIDLSVSAVLALGAVIVVQTTSGNSFWLSVVEAFAIAAVIGLGNGFLISKRLVPPFIATYGMLVFVQGARLAYTKGQASGTVPEILRTISIGQVGFLPAALIIWLIVNLILIVVLRNTRFGRWIYAVGGNPSAAQYAGIRVDAVVIGAHVACSMLALLGGLLLSGLHRLCGSQPWRGLQSEFDCRRHCGWNYLHRRPRQSVWNCRRGGAPGSSLEPGGGPGTADSLAVCHARSSSGFRNCVTGLPPVPLDPITQPYRDFFTGVII